MARSECHLLTIKATLHQFKSVLEEDDEHQVLLTDLCRTLWDILQEDFDDLARPPEKKAKSSSDAIELIVQLQSSLRSLITSGHARRVLAEIWPDAPQPQAEGLELQTPMECGYQLETEGLARRHNFEGVAELHNAEKSSRASPGLESEPRGRLEQWRKALELCNTALKLKEPDDEETPYHEADEANDSSQDFSKLSLQEQGSILPTTPVETARVLSVLHPSQNMPVALQAVLDADVDPNIIVGAVEGHSAVERDRIRRESAHA